MPIQLNIIIGTVYGILKHAASFAAQSDLGVLFHNTGEEKLKKTLLHLRWPQLPIPINCDGSTTTSIVKNTMQYNTANHIS